MSDSESLVFRRAEPADLPALRVLYDEIIDAMDASRWHAQWRKDGYPTDDDFAEAIAQGWLYLAVCGGVLAAAAVFNHHYNAGYDAVPWQVQCLPSQVLCIHTLGVSPRFQRRGIASAMVQHAMATARCQQCLCIRLDVIETNRPADLLYTSCGFSYRESRRLTYDSVCAVFNMYELVL